MAPVEALVVVAVPVAIGLPHLLPLNRVSPITAAVVWGSALALRALAAIGVALFIFVYLPETGLYTALADWCWHEVLPLISVHLGLSEHPLLHAAIVLPGLVLGVSVLWLIFGLARAWLLLRASLRRAIGEGPLGSTIIEDPGIVVAVTGLGRGRIVVSRAALDVMDAAELEASLSHELGHIRRGHRTLLLLASVCGALGKLLPGTAAASRGLHFSLERDADEYAVRRTRDPLALASAICKAGRGTVPAGATGLGSGKVTMRLDYLEGQAERASRREENAMRLIAGGLLAMTLVLAVSFPSWALASSSAGDRLSVTGADCPHHRDAT